MLIYFIVVFFFFPLGAPGVTHTLLNKEAELYLYLSGHYIIKVRVICYIFICLIYYYVCMSICGVHLTPSTFIWFQGLKLGHQINRTRTFTG